MFLLIWTACSEPEVLDTPVAACAGPYQGAFAGDYEGEVTAELDEDGLLVVSFETEDGTLVAAGGVEEDGSLTGTAPGIEVEGQFDFGPCEADGTWLVEERAGTWALVPQ
jgi:hypothetical protein